MCGINWKGEGTYTSVGIEAISGALRVNASLTNFNLRSNSIGAEGGKALAGALRVNASLTSLDLSDNFVGDAGGKAIFEALTVNASLTSLDLYWNNLGPKGGEALAEALAVNASLTVVNLLCNYLDSESATALASISKEKGISLCGIAPEQTEADFSHWELQPPDAILVAADLAVRASLTRVLAFHIWSPDCVSVSEISSAC